MSASLTLLNPLPKAAKFINYTDFDIVPIISTEPITLPLQKGDRMHVAPPSEMYLIDGNNNSYKNILPPPDDYESGDGKEPTIIQAYGQYNVYENLKNVLVYPTIATGWRLDYFPAQPPPPPEPQNATIKNNSMIIFWLIMFVFIVSVAVIIIIINNNRKAIDLYRSELSIGQRIDKYGRQ